MNEARNSSNLSAASRNGLFCLYFALKNKVIFDNEENSNFAHVLRIPAGEKRVLGSSLPSQ